MEIYTNAHIQRALATMITTNNSKGSSADYENAAVPRTRGEAMGSSGAAKRSSSIQLHGVVAIATLTTRATKEKLDSKGSTALL